MTHKSLLRVWAFGRIFLRSLVFNVTASTWIALEIFYLCIASHIKHRLSGKAKDSLTHPNTQKAVYNLARHGMWITEHIGGITYKVHGDIPEGPCIIACAHQSVWETIALQVIAPSSPIVKYELLSVPFFSTLLRGIDAIGVRRQTRKSMMHMLDDAEALLKRDPKRRLLIFPQGTRQAVDRMGPCRPGVWHLFQRTQLPVVPISLDAGLYWPRRSFLKQSGCINVHVHPTIQPYHSTHREDERAFLETLHKCFQSCIIFHAKKH